MEIDNRLRGSVVYPHQRKIFEKLLATAQAYFRGEWHDLPIKPRWARLVVAPTGIGKSHLAQCVASACDAAFFGINLASWIPVGCSRSQGRQTVQAVAHILAANERTVVMVDELDKLTYETSWTSYVRAELYALLDGTFPPGAVFDWDEKEDSEESESVARERLTRCCWILGVGTWQSLWDREISQIGFHQEEAVVGMIRNTDLCSVIPRETLNRFGSEVLTMSPMIAADYVTAIDVAVRQLPVPIQGRFRERVEKRIPNAIRDQIGCRIFEEVLSEILIEDAVADIQKNPISKRSVSGTRRTTRIPGLE